MAVVMAVVDDSVKIFNYVVRSIQRPIWLRPQAKNAASFFEFPDNFVKGS
jgi:hypothetical protein